MIIVFSGNVGLSYFTHTYSTTVLEKDEDQDREGYRALRILNPYFTTKHS
jgi:hypothetical protein